MYLGGDKWSIFLEPSGEKGKDGVEVKLKQVICLCIVVAS